MAQRERNPLLSQEEFQEGKIFAANADHVMLYIGVVLVCTSVWIGEWC